MMQRLVPHEVLGRVSSLVYLFAFSLGPLGILFGGVAATALGVRHAIFWCGLISGLICLAVLFAPGVLDPEKPRSRHVTRWCDRTSRHERRVRRVVAIGDVGPKSSVRR